MNDQFKIIKKRAVALVGAPYKYGADPKEAPNYFDCSSFVQYLYKQVSIDIPRTSIVQAADKNSIEIEYHSGRDLQPGDLLFARSDKGYYDDDSFGGRKIYIGHVAMYLGENKLIHAKSGRGVIVETLDEFAARGPNYDVVMVKRILK